MGSSIGMMTFPIYEKIKVIPNHQPACIYRYYGVSFTNELGVREFKAIKNSDHLPVVINSNNLGFVGTVPRPLKVETDADKFDKVSAQPFQIIQQDKIDSFLWGQEKHTKFQNVTRIEFEVCPKQL